MLFRKYKSKDYYCGGQKMMWTIVPQSRDYLRECVIGKEIGLFHGWTMFGTGIVELAGKSCMILPANEIKFIDEDNYNLKEITKYYNQKKEE